MDPKLVGMIESEIIYQGAKITWDDIAGLKHAKRTMTEIVVWPMKRPDIFTGLRACPKGLLLFGPPGTGKTMIGKAVATQSGATFFAISASSLTSKWIGEGEKLVRVLFAIASIKAPAVIFIDEIDSLLTQRSEGENEGTRRIKTEFLVQLDGVGTDSEAMVLVIGATNRPQELDEAARRRFVKRLYIPLPDANARQELVSNLLKDNKNDLSKEEIQKIVEQTKGYSGSDLRALSTEAAMEPIRDIALKGNIDTLSASEVRAINYRDFCMAMRQVKPSVATHELEGYLKFNKEFGCCDIQK